jgi:hypothetical protein
MLSWIGNLIAGWLMSLPQRFLAAYGLPGVIVLAAAGVLAFKIMKKTRRPFLAATVMGVLALAALWFLPTRAPGGPGGITARGPAAKRNNLRQAGTGLPGRMPTGGAMPAPHAAIPAAGGLALATMPLGAGAGSAGHSGSKGAAPVRRGGAPLVETGGEFNPLAGPDDASALEAGSPQAAGGSGAAGGKTASKAANSSGKQPGNSTPAKPATGQNGAQGTAAPPTPAPAPPPRRDASRKATDNGNAGRTSVTGDSAPPSPAKPASSGSGNSAGATAKPQKPAAKPKPGKPADKASKSTVKPSKPVAKSGRNARKPAHRSSTRVVRVPYRPQVMPRRVRMMPAPRRVRMMPPPRAGGMGGQFGGGFHGGRR